MDNLHATFPETHPLIVGDKLDNLGFEFQNPNHGEKNSAELIMADENTLRRKAFENKFRSSLRLDGADVMQANPR